MSFAAEHLRARIVAAPTYGAGRRRYGAELKRAVVEYAFAREGERATIREIAAELGLSAGVLGRWLCRARLRLKKGRVPFEPGEPPSMLDPQEATAGPSAAGASSSQTVRSDAVRGSAPCRGEAQRQASTPQRLVIPATTLAEFLEGAVTSYGSMRRAADGLGIPYSTLRGWLRNRGGNAGDGHTFIERLTAFRCGLNEMIQHLAAFLDHLNAMSERLDAFDQVRGCKSNARNQA
jgi:transposase-like protein